MKYFSFHYSLTDTFNKKFIEIFGKPRNPDTPFFTMSTGYPIYYGEKPENFDQLANENEYYADIAASIQQVTEELIINLVNEIYRSTKMDKLCIAGGVGLNSIANYKILQYTPIKEIFVQPAAGDSGGALGAALYVYYSLLDNTRRFVMEHAYWGQQYSNKEIEIFLRKINNSKIEIEYIQNDEHLFDIISDSLIEGKVVGFFQGRFEWGPRALGNRSILADPRNHKMKDIVNIKIKFREPFRPFAPSVLAEKTEEYFELPNAVIHYPSRFMLYVVKVKEDKKKLIPAVTHVDGTARLQVVFKETNPRYYHLIEKFEEKTNVPVLLNTSFNLKGEPIVNSPEDAFNTFVKSEMDILVLENFLVKKKTL
jgi:carbamoyltransferase